MERLSNYIDGELLPPSSTLYIENNNPAEGKVYSFIPD
jgi:aminomuconate-semialdehyde/2-hydroxymuconate-6-semialdehyde dehydrogenase